MLREDKIIISSFWDGQERFTWLVAFELDVEEGRPLGVEEKRMESLQRVLGIFGKWWWGIYRDLDSKSRQGLAWGVWNVRLKSLDFILQVTGTLAGECQRSWLRSLWPSHCGPWTEAGRTWKQDETLMGRACEVWIRRWTREGGSQWYRWASRGGNESEWERSWLVKFEPAWWQVMVSLVDPSTQTQRQFGRSRHALRAFWRQRKEQETEALET